MGVAEPLTNQTTGVALTASRFSDGNIDFVLADDFGWTNTKLCPGLRFINVDH